MKKQQAQLLEIVDTLQEARRNCRSLFQAGNYEAVVNLLADSQDSAVKMGAFIERLQGIGTKTVSLLEEYCELLYRISICIAEENGKPDFQSVKQSLERIRHSIQTELKPDRIEVVFFPYKASMWDSLESIWLAAEKDPQCDAVVVPIPYYDKRPDGSLGMIHYEGGDYPSYVPVVNWREYDLESRLPDVAFIHNPYDNTNTVTQVHDLYFSENLKKYAGLLCYSPYFVNAGQLNPHFAVLPAVLNADFVIVQSEEIRRQYLQVWAGLVKENRATPSDLRNMETKILPLGSPKFDAVKKSGPEEVNLPDGWKRLIIGPDGTRKKVIFYNTSISTMLGSTVGEDNEAGDAYLNKIESVLRFFERRDDVVLLWRPHPLLAQTFASMRPQLYNRYLQVVRDYKQAGFGIYDDSPDLHRAIAVSDAYYGDGSSVEVLWEETGKPLLNSKVNITTYKQRLVVTNLYFDGHSFWCTAFNFNGLFQIDKESFKIDYVGLFPHEKKEGYALFSRITECDGKLYFCPENAANVGVYDKRTKQFSSLSLGLVKEKRDQEKKYIDAFTYGKYVFITGNRVPAILRIDTRTNDITVIDDWKKQLQSRKAADSDSLLLFGCCVKERLYFPSRYANAMFIFNMRECSWEIKPFNKVNKMYYRSIPIGEKIWVCSSSNSFVGAYNIATGETVDFDTGIQCKGFSDFAVDQGHLFCFCRDVPQILKIDSDTNRITQFRVKENCEVVAIEGHYAYAVSRMTGKMNIIDLRTMEQRIEEMYCPIEKSDVEYKNEFFECEKYDGYAWENAYLNLDAFIRITKMPAEKVRKTENCGETIYRSIKGFTL